MERAAETSSNRACSRHLGLWCRRSSKSTLLGDRSYRVAKAYESLACAWGREHARFSTDKCGQLCAMNQDRPAIGIDDPGSFYVKGSGRESDLSLPAG